MMSSRSMTGWQKRIFPPSSLCIITKLVRGQEAGKGAIQRQPWVDCTNHKTGWRYALAHHCHQFVCCRSHTPPVNSINGGLHILTGSLFGHIRDVLICVVMDASLGRLSSQPAFWKLLQLIRFLEVTCPILEGRSHNGSNFCKPHRQVSCLLRV